MPRRIRPHQLHQLEPARVRALVTDGLGGHHMVLRCDGQARVADLAFVGLKTVKGAGAGRLLQYVTVYKDEIPLCIECTDQVGLPDFFEQRLRFQNSHV